MREYLKTIDWYIIKKFLSSFFFTVLLFVLIAVVIDFSEKVEKFIEEPITKKEILLQYYPSFIIWIAGQLWSVCTLIAVVFFTSRLAYNSEIISIFNAGVSYERFMRPYWVAAGIITFVYLLGSHFFLPWGEEIRQEISNKYLDKNSDKGKTTSVHLFVAPGTKVFVGFYRKDDSTARDFRLEHFEGAQLRSILKADRAKYLAKTKKWQIWDYYIHDFNDQREVLKTSFGQSIDSTINLYPADFVDFASQQSMMTTPRLMSYIRQQKARGAGNVVKYEYELLRRTGDPITIMILTIIGVTIASRKVRGGFGFHLAMGISIGAIYVFLSKFTNVFALGQTMPVWLGVWLPNIVFGVIAVFLVRGAQK
jgi:lipopolysaccharide export system permease protein